MPELPGVHSQVRRLEQAEPMIRDAISLAFDVACDDIKVNGPIPIVSPDVDDLLRSTRANREHLAELKQTVDSQSRQLAHDMAGEGIPVRDIANVLNVSFQHAAKLAKQA